MRGLKRRGVAGGFAVVVATAMLLGGCAGDTTVIGGNGEQAGIIVAGRGEVQAAPDTGYVEVGVEVTRPTVADARQTAADLASAVIDSLRANGVAEADIQTAQLSIMPRYDYRGSEPPRITGYTVTNIVSVTVRDLDMFSAIVDDAVAAGGDEVRLWGIRFDVEDREAFVEQARAAAMDDARTKAEQLAELGGAALGAPLAITETTAGAPRVVGMEEIRAADDGATPIEPGRTSITVSVAVRYAIE